MKRKSSIHVFFGQFARMKNEGNGRDLFVYEKTTAAGGIGPSDCHDHLGSALSLSKRDWQPVDCRYCRASLRNRNDSDVHCLFPRLKRIDKSCIKAGRSPDFCIFSPFIYKHWEQNTLQRGKMPFDGNLCRFSPFLYWIIQKQRPISTMSRQPFFASSALGFSLNADFPSIKGTPFPFGRGRIYGTDRRHR